MEAVLDGRTEYTTALTLPRPLQADLLHLGRGTDMFMSFVGNVSQVCLWVCLLPPGAQRCINRLKQLGLRQIKITLCRGISHVFLSILKSSVISMTPKFFFNFLLTREP